MLNTEAQELLLEILDHARETKPSEFRLLTDWESYRYCIKKRRSYKILVKGLKKSSDRMIKKYCKSVIAGISDLVTLLAYQRLVDAMNFYQKEVNTLSDMIDEYQTYMFSGNFFWAYVLQYPRAERDLRDFRK